MFLELGNKHYTPFDSYLRTNDVVALWVEKRNRRMSVSWEEFVAKHAKAVLDSALRVVAIPADAEDVAQEVFLEV